MILSNRRKHLTPHEVDVLLNTCRDFRNRTMVLIAYRHGLRVSELTSLEWSQIDLTTGTIALHRLKSGIPSNHPLTGQEIRSLRRLRRDNPNSRHVFLSSRGTPMTRQNVNAFLADLGRQGLISRSLPTCFDIPQDTSSPTMAEIHVQSSITLGIVTFSQLSSTHT
jgi:integrase